MIESEYDFCTPGAFEEAKHEARNKGFHVVECDDYTLLLDLDDEESKKQYSKMLPFFINLLGAKEYQRWDSKSGNLHVIVRLPKAFPLSERLAFQAILGSDPKRELFSMIGAVNGIQNPSILFKPK